MASDALKVNYNAIKLRSLQEATDGSKQRAKSCLRDEPAIPRPETTTRVAKRMIIGALGSVQKNKGQWSLISLFLIKFRLFQKRHFFLVYKQIRHKELEACNLGRKRESCPDLTAIVAFALVLFGTKKSWKLWTLKGWMLQSCFTNVNGRDWNSVWD